jgi:ParB family chromosome partitioning protein
MAKSQQPKQPKAPKATKAPKLPAVKKTKISAVLSAADAVVPDEIAEQIEQLNRDTDVVLSPGTIKTAMSKAHDGGSGKSRDLWQVAPSKLQVIADMNPRVNTPGYKQHIRDLTESMKMHGFFQDKPLAGYVARVGDDDIIFIYEGGSRLKAALLAIEEGAPFTEVPVSVDQKGKAMEDLLVQMVRGNTGRPLSVVENAIICKRLAKFGWESEKIAEQLGFKTQQVENMLLLMASDHRIRDLVAMEKIAATLAIQTIKEHGSKAYELLVQAQVAAESKGKTRITGRFIGNAAFKKAAAKVAEPMFDTLKLVKEDPGFASLSAEVQERLATLVTELMEAQQAAQQSAEAAEGGKGSKKKSADVIDIKAAA